LELYPSKWLHSHQLSIDQRTGILASIPWQPNSAQVTESFLEKKNAPSCAVQQSERSITLANVSPNVGFEEQPERIS
jgi:hypothetical protein